MRRTEQVAYTKGIQTPGATLPTEAENAAKIIRKYYASEPRTVDESCNLEDFFVLFPNDVWAIGFVQRDTVGVLEVTVLVNFKQLVGNVLRRASQQ